MSEPTLCFDCGAEIPTGQPRGLCPRCALKGALEPAADDSESSAAMPGVPEAGKRIGRYKLLERIGEGGCGIVYMAEQEEPVRRRVALKILKLGMDTKEVIARFEAERQALALMDHPHIARIFDGGATDTGRPYFVMELVRGVRITEYCDQKKLSTRQRLDLFMHVCQAVQHAHQKGIIHRDLKPSNILVSVNDGVAVPKVIDFGIAKATGQRLTDKTHFTKFQQLLGTPAYMSPEQAEMTSVDIDTRSDIYSLGVLLYELLTGKTPFDAKELLAAGLDAVRRAIREQEPPRPSTRLSTLQAADQTDIAKRRHTDPLKLMSLLRGDLDWIVMKCLEKDRNRRYETANGLASEIGRYMTDEPVTAAAPTAAYRFGKFARRNKAALGVAAAITAILVVATTVSTWEAVRAFRAEELAKQRVIEVAAERDAKDEAREEAVAVSTFLTEVFQSPDPKRDGRTVTVAEMLDRAVRKLETSLTNQPARRARFQGTLGGTYSALRLDREAISLLEKARDYQLATLGREHPDTLKAMHNLAGSYHYAGRRKDALELQEEVLALRREVLGPEHPDTLRAMHNLAISYHGDGRTDEALKLWEEVLALNRKVLGPEHPDTLLAANNLALSYHAAGRGDEALKLQEEVLALDRKVLGPEHPGTINAMHNLANSYHDDGRRDEALKLREEVLALNRKVLGSEHPDTLTTMHSLAVSYAAAGRRDEALKLREEVRALKRKALGGQFSFVSDFLTSSNEANSATNVWQYFYGIDTRNRAGVYQRLPVFAIGIQNSGTDVWRAGADGPPYVGVHVRSDNAFPYVAIDEGHVHPGNDGLGIAIGFRAPSNGVYQVSGSVRAAGGGSINWHLDRGTGSNLLAGGRHLQARRNQNFDTPPINLSVGEFVFLVVDNDGGWSRDSTAVEFVVTALERAAPLAVHPVTYADINTAKFQINKSVTEQVHVLLMIYGPSVVGFVVLLAACVFGRRKRTLIEASIGATVLHLITVLFLLTLASIGSWGNSSAFEFAWEYLFVGLGGIALLIAIKAAVMATRTRPGDSPSTGQVSEKRERPVLQN